MQKTNFVAICMYKQFLLLQDNFYTYSCTKTEIYSNKTPVKVFMFLPSTQPLFINQYNVYRLCGVDCFMAILASFGVLKNYFFGDHLTLDLTMTTFDTPEEKAFIKHSGKRRKCW